jgi:hypothetical protein
MPEGKGRERRRGRRAKPAPRDPTSTEAYEHGWYALLARQAGGEDDAAPEEPPGEAQDNEPKAAAEPQLATVTAIVAAVPEEPLDERPEAQPKALGRAPGTAGWSVRIGVRRLEDPESVYLRYLTASRHRVFFRSDLWPSSTSITPVHLWRANHLGAGWDIVEVERFMDVAATLADELVASAPRAEPPGVPERRSWIGRFLAAEWVREFGHDRVSKTLLPMVPDLLPDFEPALMSWARARWLGLGGSDEPEGPDRCLESWELLEDALVLRGQYLGQIVRRLHRLAPALAPVGSLGLIQAAFWDDLWTETDPATTRSRRAPRRRTPAARRSTSEAPGPEKAPARRRSTPKPAAPDSESPVEPG